jgi:hypothetical protein
LAPAASRRLRRRGSRLSGCRCSLTCAYVILVPTRTASLPLKFCHLKIPQSMVCWVDLDPERFAAGHLCRDQRCAAAQERIINPVARLGIVKNRAPHGRRHTVTVEPQGYVWEGKPYSSLSAIARAITGTAWSGPRFFALKSSGRSNSPPDAAHGRSTTRRRNYSHSPAEASKVPPQDPRRACRAEPH